MSSHSVEQHQEATCLSKSSHDSHFELIFKKCIQRKREAPFKYTTNAFTPQWAGEKKNSAVSGNAALIHIHALKCLF